MRNLVICFSFLAVALISLTLFVGVTITNPKPILTKIHPHFYDNEKVSLEKIKITVFYFVPKDALDKEQETWKESTDQNLKKLLNFHALMFKNSSKITYEFFPEILIGQKTTSDYESLFDKEGNDALIPVKEEITQRVFSPEGDLYTIRPNKDATGIKNVYLVVFEGNGAAGNGDFALISRSYVTDKQYEETGSTFLAHEFYHTLGLLDNYQQSFYVYSDNQKIPVSILTNKDIMGQVNIPLPYTYIDTATLKKMGM